ncbi:hypothetical protein PF002_g14040 [Phytophthora fragariae]|uniref:Uncharacterized protein n=1 Tax=Phytophthora fragariae TaxID=53985 RepID=A0A6A3YZD3_9STRA|nr:hypothetical protein PF002_g14040 [Phytophthora fragariae]
MVICRLTLKTNELRAALPRPEEANALVQDIVDFTDSCEDQQSYERRRREKKKAEKEALKTQVQQYEVQLELLRLRQPIRQNLLTQNSDLAERAQSVLSNRHSCAPSAPLATFPTLGAIASR